MDDQSLAKTEDEFRARLQRDLRSTAVGSYARYRAGAMERMRSQRRSLRIAGALASGIAVVILAVLIGSTLADVRRNAAASPSPTLPSPAASGSPTAVTSATPVASPSASPTAGASGRLITYENPILGYRISLPEAYRRLSPVVFTSVTQSEILGRDTYTLLTQQQERDECLRDLGDLPSPTAAALLFVEAYRNVAGESATEWASTPRVPGAQPLSMHRKIEPFPIGGRDAVKLVADRATAETEVIVIRADDRIYVLTPTMWSFPPQHRLEDIAATFGTVARQPFPTPTPSPAPEARRQAASELAAALAQAFAARDADEVARLMPDCHLGVSPLIDRGGLPNSGGGGLSRSVVLFTQALRDRFAAGDLTVTVDPTLQVDGLGFAQFFVRSEWKDPDRTTVIDLLLDQRDGRWQWVSARHHFRLADLGSPPCIPYRSPWVSGTSRC